MARILDLLIYSNTSFKVIKSSKDWSSPMKVAGPLPTHNWSLVNSEIFLLNMVLCIINIGLLVILIYIFFSGHIREKSKYKSILLVFAVVLITQNSIILFYFLTSSFLSPAMGMPIFAINLLEATYIISILIMGWQQR